MRSQTAWEGGFVQKGRSISQEFGNGKRRLPTGRTGWSQRLGWPEDFDQALFLICRRGPARRCYPLLCEEVPVVMIVAKAKAQAKAKAARIPLQGTRTPLPLPAPRSPLPVPRTPPRARRRALALGALDTDGELLFASGQFEEAVEGVEVFSSEEPDPLLSEQPDALLAEQLVSEEPDALLAEHLLAEQPPSPFAEVHAETDVEVGMADQYLL